MVKTIAIGGKEYIFAANAATPFRYKQLFNEDLFVVFSEAAKTEESAPLAETVAKMAYIMIRQAEKADMNKISMEDFMSWLEDFGPMDLMIAGEEIMNFYLSSTTGTSIPKKK